MHSQKPCAVRSDTAQDIADAQCERDYMNAIHPNGQRDNPNTHLVYLSGWAAGRTYGLAEMNELHKLRTSGRSSRRVLMWMWIFSILWIAFLGWLFLYRPRV